MVTGVKGVFPNPWEKFFCLYLHISFYFQKFIRNFTILRIRMLSITEAALQLGISEQTIKNWGERGVLTLTKVGRCYCVDETSLENIKKHAPELLKQMRATEVLREELERTSRTYMDEIKEYKLEMMMRKESAQRVNLYMEIFASLTDLIYEGRYDEREYKAVVMFLKGHSIKDIADNLGSSKQTIVADIRKCNEILFNLQPYTKMQETNRESGRKARLAEKKEKILRTMLDVYRMEGTTFLDNMQEDDIEKMMTPLDELNLSLKTKKALSNGRIKYLGDIIAYGEERLMKISGFGPISLQEIKGWMARYNLSMRMRIPAWDTIKQAYAKQTPYIYEKLFKLDAETQEYLETCIEGLPEDRATEIRELFLGLFAMGEQYKNNFTKYKQINLALRDEILRMEKCLKNEDYYLSPAYDEVKKLFANAERMKERKERYSTGEENLEPIGKAMGFLDCIFSQQAIVAESEYRKKSEQTMADLRIKIKKLETRLNEKSHKQEKETKKKTLTYQDLEDAVAKARIKELEAEVATMRSLNDYYEKKAKARTTDSAVIKQLQKERDEAIKNLERQNLEIKQLQFDKKSRDLTIEKLSQAKNVPEQNVMLDTENEHLKRAEEEAKQMAKERDEAVKKLKETIEECKKTLQSDKKDHQLMNQEQYDCKIKLLDEQRHSISQKGEIMDKEREIRMLNDQIFSIKQEHRNNIFDLWRALHKYEFQTKCFNSSLFFEKPFIKQKLYSDFAKTELFNLDE